MKVIDWLKVVNKVCGEGIDWLRICWEASESLRVLKGMSDKTERDWGKAEVGEVPGKTTLQKQYRWKDLTHSSVSHLTTSL